MSDRRSSLALVDAQDQVAVHFHNVVAADTHLRCEHLVLLREGLRNSDPAVWSLVRLEPDGCLDDFLTQQRFDGDVFDDVLVTQTCCAGLPFDKPLFHL